VRCGKQRLLVALHGDRGGPDVCIECSGELLLEAKERRRHDDRMVRAATTAIGDIFSRRAVENGAMAERMDANQLAELFDDKVLEDLIRLAHPDLHTGSRKDTATRVASTLIAMRPYVRPHREPALRDVFAAPARGDDRPAVTEPRYPCDICRYLYLPHLYCDPCRARWNEIHRREMDRINARRRQRRVYLKQLRKLNAGYSGTQCAYCGERFAPNRKDQRYCTPAHKQAAYRNRRDTEAAT
jgi:hypothetical protein